MRGITFGAFDFVHPGHILLFKEAKQHCDYLIVGLHVDPSNERASKNKPVLTVKERRMMLAACKFVDEIVEYETERDLLEILAEFKPDIRFLGTDYLGKDYTGRGLVPVHFHERNHDWSSTSIRERLCK